MGSLLLGAALGAAFQLLFNSAIDAAHTMKGFGSSLQRLNSTLASISPAIEHIARFDTAVLEIKALLDLLIKGQLLLDQCSQVKPWNVFKRLYYSRKLKSLEASLQRFFQVNMVALHYRETTRVSAAVSGLEEKINEIMAALVLRQSLSTESFQLERDMLAEDIQLINTATIDPNIVAAELRVN